MTNKLPVVGKRYKPNNLNLRSFYKFEYEIIAITEKNIAVKIVESAFKHLLGTIKVYDINSIKHKLEELPQTKLPVVGNGYLRIGEDYEIVVKKVERDCVYFRMAGENNKESFSCPLELFWKDFEELPEDKAETINCGNISCEYKSECDSSRRILPKIDQIYIKKTRYARITNVDSEGVTYLEQDGKEFWDCFKDFLDFFEPAEAETKPENQSHISETSLIPSNSRELSPEVKQVMGDLKVVCNEKVVDGFKIRNLAEQLIDALDKQFMSKEEVKIDTSSEVCLSNNEMKPDENGSFKHLDNAEEISQEIMKKSAEKSIWKPVSELPNIPCDVIMEYGYEDEEGKEQTSHVLAYYQIREERFKTVKGSICDAIDIKKYCAISDFIKDYEKLKEIVKKLEEK